MMWLAILKVLCTLLPIITFASPATVFLPVLLNGDDNDGVIAMPPLALTTQMLQCFLFGIYAHHLQMWALFIPNVAGFLLGFLWSTIYPLKLAADDNQLKTQWKVQYTCFASHATGFIDCAKDTLSGIVNGSCSRCSHVHISISNNATCLS